MIRMVFSRPLRGLGDSLAPIGWYLLFAFGVTTLARIALGLWFAGRVAEGSGWIFILLQGLRYDLILQGMLLLLILPLTPLLCAFDATRRLWQRLLPLYLTLCVLFLAFMELATPWFIDEYGLRPNILFVKY